MSTFNYNAIVSLAEVVADRLVKASISEGTVKNTFSREISPGFGLTGRFHVLISDSAVEFGTGTRDHVWLTMNIHAVLELSQPALGIADGDWLKASVSVMTQMITKGAVLSPKFDDLTTPDVSVGNVQSNNGILAGMGPLLLPAEIAKSLKDDPEFKKLAIDLGFDSHELLSDAVDSVVLDGPPPEDRDELALAFYNSKDPVNTRGGAAGVKLSLVPGKSVTLRLSKTIVDSIIAEELNTRFMRFDVALGEPVPEQLGGTPLPYQPSGDQMLRGILWGESHSLFPGGAAAPATHYIKIQPDPRRDNLWCAVTNLRTGETQNFTTTSTGEGIWAGASILGGHAIQMNDIEQGDTLRFHGEYKSYGERSIYYPDIQLSDGCIQIAAKAVSDIVCYDDVTVHLKGQVTLAIDPATGEVQAYSEEPDVDLPWYVDIGVGLLKFAIYAFTGPLGSTIIEEPSLAGELARAALQSGHSLIPTIPGGNRLHLFWEDLTLKPDEIIVSGQLEAGWILSGGRSQGLIVDLDDGQQLAIGSKSADLWGVSDGAGGVVRVTTKSFEQLNLEELAKLTYQPDTTSVPSGPALEGLVLAVRTAYDRFAKVRVDRSKQGKYLARWITYGRPSDPSVSIVGTLNVKHGDEPEDTRAWGTFKIHVEGLYSDYGLVAVWQYDGPGKAFVHPNDDKSIVIEIDFATDIPKSSFEFNPALEMFGIRKVLTATGSLRVFVKDTFNRVASAEKVITCQSPSEAGGLKELWPTYATQWELVKWLRSSDPAAAQLRGMITRREFNQLLSLTEVAESQAGKGD